MLLLTISCSAILVARVPALLVAILPALLVAFFLVVIGQKIMFMLFHGSKENILFIDHVAR